MEYVYYESEAMVLLAGVGLKRRGAKRSTVSAPPTAPVTG